MSETVVDVDGILYAAALSRKIVELTPQIAEEEVRYAKWDAEEKERYCRSVDAHAKWAKLPWWKKRKMPEPYVPFVSPRPSYRRIAHSVEYMQRTIKGLHPYCMYHISMEETISLELRTVERKA